MKHKVLLLTFSIMSIFLMSLESYADINHDRHIYALWGDFKEKELLDEVVREIDILIKEIYAAPDDDHVELTYQKNKTDEQRLKDRYFFMIQHLNKPGSIEAEAFNKTGQEFFSKFEARLKLFETNLEELDIPFTPEEERELPKTIDYINKLNLGGITLEKKGNIINLYLDLGAIIENDQKSIFQTRHFREEIEEWDEADLEEKTSKFADLVVQIQRNRLGGPFNKKKKDSRVAAIELFKTNLENIALSTTSVYRLASHLYYYDPKAILNITEPGRYFKLLADGHQRKAILLQQLARKNSLFYRSMDRGHRAIQWTAKGITGNASGKSLVGGSIKLVRFALAGAYFVYSGITYGNMKAEYHKLMQTHSLSPQEQARFEGRLTMQFLNTVAAGILATPVFVNPYTVGVALSIMIANVIDAHYIEKGEFGVSDSFGYARGIWRDMQSGHLLKNKEYNAYLDELKANTILSRVYDGADDIVKSKLNPIGKDKGLAEGYFQEKMNYIKREMLVATDIDKVNDLFMEHRDYIRSVALGRFYVLHDRLKALGEWRNVLPYKDDEKEAPLATQLQVLNPIAMGYSVYKFHAKNFYAVDEKKRKEAILEFIKEFNNFEEIYRKENDKVKAIYKEKKKKLGGSNTVQTVFSRLASLEDESAKKKIHFIEDMANESSGVKAIADSLVGAGNQLTSAAFSPLVSKKVQDRIKNDRDFYLELSTEFKGKIKDKEDFIVDFITKYNAVKAYCAKNTCKGYDVLMTTFEGMVEKVEELFKTREGNIFDGDFGEFFGLVITVNSMYGLMLQAEGIEKTRQAFMSRLTKNYNSIIKEEGEASIDTIFHYLISLYIKFLKEKAFIPEEQNMSSNEFMALDVDQTVNLSDELNLSRFAHMVSENELRAIENDTEYYIELAERLKEQLRFNPNFVQEFSEKYNMIKRICKNHECEGLIDYSYSVDDIIERLERAFNSKKRALTENEVATILLLIIKVNLVYEFILTVEEMMGEPEGEIHVPQDATKTPALKLPQQDKASEIFKKDE